MKLSQFEIILKNNLPKWEIELDFKTIRLTLKDRWSSENELHSSDLDYIKQVFRLNHVTVINTIWGFEPENMAIVSTINFNHDLEFEKEDEEE